VARGKANPHDVDVLVEFIEKPGLLNFMGVKVKIEEWRGLPIYLGSKTACPERFHKRIKNERFHVS